METGYSFPGQKRTERETDYLLNLIVKDWWIYAAAPYTPL
jgi:hypothetical protein